MDNRFPPLAPPDPPPSAASLPWKEGIVLAIILLIVVLAL